VSEVRFTAFVKPEPQGSSKAFIVKGQWGKSDRAVITSDNKDLKSFRSEVTREAIRAVAALNHPRPMAAKHVPVSIEIDFYFQKPPSISKKRTEMVVRPDADKCIRSVLDSCTGVLFEDDAQVVSIVARKHYGTPERVEVTAGCGVEIQVSAAQPEMAGTLF
jgi:Holliday junction resolvase RusA-like endonuclease